MSLTTVATISAGDELLWLLVAVLLLGPQTEAADGDGLCHGLVEGQRRKFRPCVKLTALVNKNNTEVPCPAAVNVAAYVSELTAD